MTTKLERISELSKQHPEMKFNSIGHLINIEMLKECHYKMDGRKAVGIDGISKEEYNSNLDNNLKQLVEKLRIILSRRYSDIRFSRKNWKFTSNIFCLTKRKNIHIITNGN